jgi:predicted acylesterase/phospholipase RssA
MPDPDQSHSPSTIVPEPKAITVAKAALESGGLAPVELLDLSGELKRIMSFTYARRVLERAAADCGPEIPSEIRLKIHQQWSLCTYKDTDLPADARLDRALDILELVEDLRTTEDQETLGLIGSIYKQKWQIDNQKQQLERSLLYYERGYKFGAENDQGYTGINAAFVLDLLAGIEEEDAARASVVAPGAAARRKKAEGIRLDVIEKIVPVINELDATSPGREWLYSVVAEAYFGLRQYEEAIVWLERGRTKRREELGEIPPWEEESTINQLARLSIAQQPSNLSADEFERTEAWRALQRVFGNHPAAVRTAFIGKIGLALSGGGFRAALFHIGTLARLAELDVLRHVEVISGVSGGSIIGAHYYLEVRELLKSKTDAEITKKDYIDLVARIEKEFLAGVQSNIRVRVAAAFTTNLKMIFSSKYSRTKRAGELYEEKIFSRVDDKEGQDPRWLNELNIFPNGEGPNFAPKLHNWKRSAKAPVLVLNAATLNTGHTWQFTTTWMGEPPSSIDIEVDTNDQLRRMYYREAPAEHQRIRLGHAVAASACVPGLFEPLSLENLYPDRVVRLVDGGVCDNQGMSSLLEQNCTVILVSDGSGQMTSEKIPSNGPLGVPLRSNSILQSRIRDAQYHDLERRRRSSLLRGLMFIHLKEDLDSPRIDWIGSKDKMDGGSADPSSAADQDQTGYGIAKDIQQCLAGTRTDLDSFTDLEAYALMTSAYCMTERAFEKRMCVEGFSDGGTRHEWKFLQIQSGLASHGAEYDYVRKLLGVSKSLAFKVWKQSRILKVIAIILGLGALALAVWLSFRYANAKIVPALTLYDIGRAIFGMAMVTLAAYLFGSLFGRAIKWRETLVRMAIGITVSLFGWAVAGLHLLIFDRMFLKRGSLASFLAQRKPIASTDHIRTEESLR